MNVIAEPYFDQFRQAGGNRRNIFRLGSESERQIAFFVHGDEYRGDDQKRTGRDQATRNPKPRRPKRRRDRYAETSPDTGLKAGWNRGSVYGCFQVLAHIAHIQNNALVQRFYSRTVRDF